MLQNFIDWAPVSEASFIAASHKLDAVLEISVMISSVICCAKNENK